MHNVVWITLLLFAFDRVIQHPAAGKCAYTISKKQIVIREALIKKYH